MLLDPRLKQQWVNDPARPRNWQAVGKPNIVICKLGDFGKDGNHAPAFPLLSILGLSETVPQVAHCK